MTKQYLTGATHLPNVLDKQAINISVDDQPIQLLIYDTNCTPQYDILRSRSYKQCDIFILCYDMTSTQSLHHIITKWAHEVRYHIHNVPILIVGTKYDLRQPHISQPQIDHCVRHVYASKSVVCSSITQYGMF